MSTELQTAQFSQIENVLINGDLATLKPEERVIYYNRVCESTRLNPLTRPFEYIKLNGKLTLYARKDCTDQLRAVHGISIRITGREKIGDVYIVTASATSKDGRCDESTGAVNISGLKGEAMANAFMKAETKAKRRVTLSIAGLGLLDEHEVETVPNAMKVDLETGEIIEGELIRNKVTHTPHPQEISPKEDMEAFNTYLAIVKDFLANGDRLGIVEVWRDMDKPMIAKIWRLLNAEQQAFIKETLANAPKEEAKKPSEFVRV